MKKICYLVNLLVLKDLQLKDINSLTAALTKRRLEALMIAKVYKTQPVILLLFHDRTQLIMIHSGQKVSIINALLWSLVVCMKLKLNWLCFQLMFAGPGHPIISCFTCAARPHPVTYLSSRHLNNGFYNRETCV